MLGFCWKNAAAALAVASTPGTQVQLWPIKDDVYEPLATSPDACAHHVEDSLSVSLSHAQAIWMPDHTPPMCKPTSARAF